MAIQAPLEPCPSCGAHFPVSDGSVHRLTVDAYAAQHPAPPESPGDVTVAQVLAATHVDAHKRAVEAWAKPVWDAWHTFHDTLRAWARAAWSRD